MTRLDKHPALMEAYELIQSIEKLGASVELTNTVVQAGKLMRTIEDMVDGWKADATSLEEAIGRLNVDLNAAVLARRQAEAKLCLVYQADGEAVNFGTEEDVKKFRIMCAQRIDNMTKEKETFVKKLFEEKLRRALAVLALESKLRIKEEANAVLMDAMHRMEQDRSHTAFMEGFMKSYKRTLLNRVLDVLRTVTLSVPITMEVDAGTLRAETHSDVVKVKLPMAHMTRILQKYLPDNEGNPTFSTEG